MKICIIGAGAIGGLLAVRLADAGEDVTIVARGAHLAAIRERGLTLREEGRETNARPRAASDLTEVAGQDLVRDGDAVAVQELTRAEAEAAQKALQP